ncbi:MAG: GDSL-type esterase/lipase family protein [Lawsonibacter sp.]|jgi:hypothetical protein
MYFQYKRRLLAGLLLSAALLSGCTSKPPVPEGSGSAGPDVSAAAGSGSAPDASQQGGESVLAGSSPVDGSQDLEASGSGEAAAYDFSQPAPEREAVDNSYFEDAAFVGDSRTDGFMIYSGIGCGENLTSNGLSIFKLEEKKALTIDGQKYTLLEALALKQYGKVYLSLGVNELGYYNDQGFYDAYCNAIDAIRASQPNAVIYIQGLIPLNEDVIAQSGGPSYLTNEHLLVYNDLMRKAAEEKQVVFLDLNPEFTGADGQLPADASKDGVHLRKAYCERWLDYLKTHTVDYETLYPEQGGAV